MKALILNSGIGKRMGDITENHPKCMTELSVGETIISRQLNALSDAGIKEVIITTGPFGDMLEDYCRSLNTELELTFINNPEYETTNYIYSVFLAKKYLCDDILLIHGDLVFESRVLFEVLSAEKSVMTVSSTSPLPEKDFKAVIDNRRITAVGVNLFENALAAQPLYKLTRDTLAVWLDKISDFCENGKKSCYAEDAFNLISSQCEIFPLDIKNQLLGEIDNTDDLEKIKKELERIKNRKVYISFSSDVVHSGHISIIKKASRLGKLTVGVLSDEAVASYKRFPLLPFEERRSLFASINGVYRTVEQKTLSYADILRKEKPDIVVHGDNWRQGIQKPVRDEVIKILAEYGGELVEFEYTTNEKLKELDKRERQSLSVPESRRGILRRLLSIKPLVTILEAHSGITGLIAENTVVYKNGAAHQFDGMWVSSLCDSTARGKPDIELIDISSRLRTVDDIMEVTTKPIIFDGDTGGLAEHFVYTVRTLERMGVSAIIIEDKTGLKKNSLFGTEAKQTQDGIESFCEKIRAGKNACKTKEFMIIARIESLILERGMKDALSRAAAYTNAGADGIMIHSRKKEPDEIFEFIEEFRKRDTVTPIVVVPTTYNGVYEDEFAARGANIVIYANQLTRSGFPAMQKTAESILNNRRSLEADEYCMPIKEIISLIPEE